MANAHQGRVLTKGFGILLLGHEPGWTNITDGLSPEQLAYVNNATGATTPTFGENLGNMGRGFTSREGLAAAGKPVHESFLYAMPIATGRRYYEPK